MPEEEHAEGLAERPGQVWLESQLCIKGHRHLEGKRKEIETGHECGVRAMEHSRSWEEKSRRGSPDLAMSALNLWGLAGWGVVVWKAATEEGWEPRGRGCLREVGGLPGRAQSAHPICLAPGSAARKSTCRS